VPFERLDIAIPEDLVEEIGRIWGYARITPVVPGAGKPKEVNSTFFYSQKIRETLSALGFSEVQTSSFASMGEVELANALASDKNYLRSRLFTSLASVAALNATNVALLGLSDIRLFEIGKVFDKKGERLALAFAFWVPKSKDQKNIETQIADEAQRAVHEALGVELTWREEALGVFEASEDLADVFEKLPQPKSIESYLKKEDITYKAFSLYPFVLRDIAIFVPDDVSADDVLGVIKKEAGELFVRGTLFDTFKKEGRISYAFRLVFQSHEKTLSDGEVNVIMEKITAALGERGWEVR